MYKVKMLKNDGYSRQKDWVVTVDNEKGRQLVKDKMCIVLRTDDPNYKPNNKED